MADRQVIGTEAPQDGATRIIRKLDSIERKLTLLLWLIALPFIVMAVMFVLNFIAAFAYYG